MQAECLPLSQTPGRCGPEWGGRCNKYLVDYAVYCNVENGWCGTSDDHKNAQDGDEYDWQPKTCKSKMYHILLINKPFSKILDFKHQDFEEFKRICLFSD